MAAKDRMAVLSAMMEQGVIPVFYHPDAEVCVNVIQACANGGAKCAEFTNRGDFAAHVFFDVTRHFAKADPSVNQRGRVRIFWRFQLGADTGGSRPRRRAAFENFLSKVARPVHRPDWAKCRASEKSTPRR